VPKSQVVLPERVRNAEYKRHPVSAELYVPEIYQPVGLLVSSTWAPSPGSSAHPTHAEPAQ